MSDGESMSVAALIRGIEKRRVFSSFKFAEFRDMDLVPQDTGIRKKHEFFLAPSSISVRKSRRGRQGALPSAISSSSWIGHGTIKSRL
jgi:hypothetical protein